VNQAIVEKSSPWSFSRKSSYISFTLVLSSNTLFTFLSLTLFFPFSLPPHRQSLFPLYIPLLGILSLHLYAPKLFPGYLSYQDSVEGSRRGC